MLAIFRIKKEDPELLRSDAWGRRAKSDA